MTRIREKAVKTEPDMVLSSKRAAQQIFLIKINEWVQSTEFLGRLTELEG